MNKVDVGALISLIEERPVIWDNTAEIYKNKVLRQAAWREICFILNDGLKEKNKTQMQEFGRAVLKKWTYIRDSWCKYIKNTLDKKPYKYYDQLSFLKKVIDTSTNAGRKSERPKDLTYVETDDGEAMLDEEEDSEHVEETENVNQTGTENNAEETINEGGARNENGGHRNLDELIRKQYEGAEKMIQLIDNANKQQDEDAHLHFFKSLLPITSTLDMDETLQFRAGVMGLLQNITRERQRSLEGIRSEVYVCPHIII